MPKRVSLKGKGAELFFGDYPATPEADSPAVPTRAQDGQQPEPSAAIEAPLSPPREGHPDTAPRRPRTAAVREAPQPARPPKRGTFTLASPEDSVLASQPAITLASVRADEIESIRQIIKVPGREVSFVRLTPEEKAHLSDIVYTFKRQGQKTSETEINRIAINFLLLDFHEHGEQSVLARVLAALRA